MAKLDLANTVVQAPSRGMITDLRADVGQYVTTVNPRHLRCLDQSRIHREQPRNLHSGTPVEILFDVLPSRVFVGKVRSVGLRMSAGQAQRPGTLPAGNNSRDWLRQSQRFPVMIGFDVMQQ